MGEQPQHLRALEAAQAIRLARARLLRRLEEGEVQLGDVLEHAAVQTAEVLDVVERVAFEYRRRAPGARRIRRQPVRAKRILLTLGISENRRVEMLTTRERIALQGAVVAATTNEAA